MDKTRLLRCFDVLLEIRALQEGKPRTFKASSEDERIEISEDQSRVQLLLRKYYGADPGLEATWHLAVADVAERLGMEHAGGILRMSYLAFERALIQTHPAEVIPRFGFHLHRPFIYWNWQPYPLKKRSWQVLKAIWGKNSVEFLDLGPAVWGEEKPANTIKPRISNLNGELAGHGINLVFTCTDESVTLLEGQWPHLDLLR